MGLAHYRGYKQNSNSHIDLLTVRDAVFDETFPPGLVISQEYFPAMLEVAVFIFNLEVVTCIFSGCCN